MTLEQLGAAIKEKREASGLTLEDIASRIKVSSRILSTIEQGSLNGLPHAVYTKSFIRSFGRIVGYDHAELDEALDELFPANAFDDAKSEPSIMLVNPGLSRSNAGKRLGVIVVLILVLVGLIGGGWYVAVNYGDDIVELVKKPFHAITSSNEYANPAFKKITAEAPTSDNLHPNELRKQGLPQPASSLTENTPAPAGVLASKPDGMEANQNTPVITENALPQALEPTILRDTTAEKKGMHQVVLNATASCWLRISADGQAKWDYTLRAGERFVLPYNDRLYLSLGNPAGVEILHDGKEFALQGSKGKPSMIEFPQMLQ